MFMEIQIHKESHARDYSEEERRRFSQCSFPLKLRSSTEELNKVDEIKPMIMLKGKQSETEKEFHSE